eukprot:g8931.t1
MSSLASDGTDKGLKLGFLKDLHTKYVLSLDKDKESYEYIASEHLRMSGVYWGLMAMELIKEGDSMDKEAIVEWVISSQDAETGGWGGNAGHDPHILYTTSAVQLLAICNSLPKIDADKVAKYIASLQQEDGSFVGDKWMEVDTRFSYCAMLTLSIIKRLDCIDMDKATAFVATCKNFDGGFGCVPGAESHAAQCFCCVAALSIGNALHYVDRDQLGWWMAERQCDSGGLNGRPEKQSDVCYSWWILSVLHIIGRTKWIDKQKLVNFILECQNDDDGGIGDRPGNMSDVFHTFFGTAGLCLLEYFSQPSTRMEHAQIDPTFALPHHVVQSLGLACEVLEEDHGGI